MGPLAVSNLAWPPGTLDEALALLARLGCGGVEIAPFAVFGRWEGIAGEARQLRQRIEAHGLECVALQGILFGAEDVSLFGTAVQRGRLEAHLDHVAALAGLLGARACVFGAPNQRDPGGLGADEAWEMALGGLRRIGPAFDAVGSALAFEANSSRYGCRFVTTTAEAVRLVQEASCPGIGLQIDTGTIFLEHEDPAVLLDAAVLAVHAHVSEPGLREPGLREPGLREPGLREPALQEPGLQGVGGVDHAAVAAGLRDSLYGGSISIEMRDAGGDWAGAVERAVAFVREAYF